MWAHGNLVANPSHFLLTLCGFGDVSIELRRLILLYGHDRNIAMQCDAMQCTPFPCLVLSCCLHPPLHNPRISVVFFELLVLARDERVVPKVLRESGGAAEGAQTGAPLPQAGS